jgi:hypothetical protein
VDVGAPATFVITGNMFGGGSGRIGFEGVIAEVIDGVPFVSVEASTVVSESGNFDGRVARICGALT